MSLGKISSSVHVARDTVSRILEKKNGMGSFQDPLGFYKLAHVVFSDESMFRTFSQSSSNRIRRFDYERLRPICTKTVVAHGTQVHVLGCFSRSGVGILKRIK